MPATTDTGRRRPAIALLLAALAAVTAGGCRPGGDTGGGGTADSTAAAATADSAAVFGYLGDTDEAAARVIVVAWRGAAGAPPTVTRTRDQARELAGRLAQEAREHALFADVARRYSDDPATAARGGYAGIIRKGAWPLPLEVALFDLPVGGISPPVATDRGYVVLMRLPVIRVRTHHILIAWRGAAGAGPSVTRSEEEARLLAAEVRRLAVDGGADPCDLAARYSDDLDNRFRCGLLGDVEPYAMPETLARVLLKLRPGDISPPVRTEHGYHLLWREPDAASP